MLRLRHRHAVTGHDDDALRIREQQGDFVGLNRLDRADNSRRSRLRAAAGTERTKQNIRDRPVHRLAHEQREQRSGGTDQRARDNHREIVDYKTIRRDRKSGEGIQQRDDDRHVRATNRHDHCDAEK